MREKHERQYKCYNNNIKELANTFLDKYNRNKYKPRQKSITC